MKIKIPVSWEVRYEYEVEADSVEEAIEKAEHIENEEGGIPLPKGGGEYIDGSFKIETDIDYVGCFNKEAPLYKKKKED